MKQKEFYRSQFLFKEGQETKKFFVIKEGEFKVTKQMVLHQKDL